jgi:DNA-directed RNA polymerase subunit K/omega
VERDHRGVDAFPEDSVTDSLPTSLQDAVAGSFHKTALLQKRVRELIKGAIPLIETREKNPIRIAYLEMQQGLIELMPEEETNAGAPLPMGTPLE